jgi:hypothetical protein
MICATKAREISRIRPLELILMDINISVQERAATGGYYIIYDYALSRYMTTQEQRDEVASRMRNLGYTISYLDNGAQEINWENAKEPCF